MFIVERSGSTSKYIAKASKGKHFDRALQTIRHYNKESRFGIASTGKPCYQLTTKLSDGPQIAGWGATGKRNKRPNGFAMQAVGMVMKDPEVGWQADKFHVVVALVSAPPAKPDITKERFSNSCDESPPSGERARDLLSERNALLIVLVYGDIDVFKSWVEYVKLMDSPALVRKLPFNKPEELSSIIPECVTHMLCSVTTRKGKTSELYPDPFPNLTANPTPDPTSEQDKNSNDNNSVSLCDHRFVLKYKYLKVFLLHFSHFIVSSVM